MTAHTLSMPEFDFQNLIAASLNTAPKTVIFNGCSDARLFPDAWVALLEAAGHEAGYPELVPGGCNVLAEYSKSPTVGPEAARVLGHNHALLEAAAPTIKELLWLNHTDCARQAMAGIQHSDNNEDLKYSLNAARRAGAVLLQDFAKPSVQQHLKSLGYKSLFMRIGTFDTHAGAWHLSGRLPLL